MLELREFFVQGGDRDKSHVLLHIVEPSNDFERREKGYFFALAEINNGTIEQIEHLQQMINDLESGYYETDDGKDKNSFESTLEFINRRGHHILQGKRAKISCVVGVIHNGKISFSYHGQPSIKMIYGKQNKFEMIDIIENNEENHEQLFSSILQGSLNEGDFFYVATPHVETKIDNDTLLDLLPEQTPEESARDIQRNLNALRDEISYGGIIFQLPQSLAHIKAEKIPHAEKEELVVEKKEKAPAEPETNYRPRDKHPKEPLTNLVLINIGRTIVAGGVFIYKLFKNIFIFFGKFFIGLIILITNKSGQRAEVLQSINTYIEKKKSYIKNLPLISKVLFVTTLILAVFFAASVFFLRIKEQVKVQEETYKNQILAIVDKKNAADSSMIYNDDTKAFGLLKEAQEMIAGLPNHTQTQKDKILELQNDISASIKILQKINTVKPEIFTNLAQTQTSVNASKISLINDDIIAYGPEDLFIYKINIKTGEMTKKEHQNIPYFIAANTPKEQDKVIFLTKENLIAEYSPKNDTISIKEMPLIEKSSLSDVFIYSQRLYTIDQANNQIFKHNQTQTGYDKGTPWIKNNDANLSDAISFAIDGDMFTLKQNGEILKFVSGARQAFSVSGLDPALENPTEIWTYNSVKNLYILEPKNKRVVVLDKQGKLLQQYTAEEWKNPTGMLVIEDKKVIYVLDNNIIYRFGIE